MNIAKAQERTYKQLLRLVTKKERGLNPNPYRKIYARFSTIYATDTYTLIAIEFKNVRCGEDCWQTVEFENGGFVFNDVTELRFSDDYFARMFNRNYKTAFECKISPAQLAPVCEIFKRLDMSMHIVFCEDRLIATGHNKIASIQAMVMGLR